jgi:tRNA pseudouridine55 synthase
MNGVLVVDKPAGRTSHDVVAMARRALGETRIGHTGTLDPLATGVLALVVGRATRLAQFMSSATKEYLAGVRFGATSPTFDADGLTTPTRDPNEDLGVDAAIVESNLEHFRGSYLQTPPPFSAKKVDGVPAYKRARANQPVELKPVPVTVSALELVAYEAGVARLRVVCTSGFYVRTLAHELGQRIGCGAYLNALRRVRAGEFTLDHAVTVEVMLAGEPTVGSRLIPMDALLPTLPPVVLTEEGARRASHGNALSPRDVVGALTCDGAPHVRLMDLEGHLIGVGAPGPDGLLRPAVVLV